MSKERQEPEGVPSPTPVEAFGFTRQERLFDRVSHQRLLEFLDSDATLVRRVEMSSNSFGEFLFVTLSRSTSKHRTWVTFYGAGYHEYRERWLVDEWFWYAAHARQEEQAPIPNDEAKSLVQQRMAEIQGDAQRASQTKQGALFEMIADMTDDDGTIAEMQDLNGFAGSLTDETR